MRVELEDFKTGWFGVGVTMRLHEIDTLITLLNRLKNDPSQHFHIGSNFEGDGGVSDISFQLAEADVKDNAQVLSLAIPPNR